MLLKSRKFWLAILDAVISLTLVVVSIQWPAYQELAVSIIGYIQPIFVILIAALTVDDTVKAWQFVKEKEIIATQAQLNARLK